MPNENMLSLIKTLRFNGMLSQFNEIMEMAEIKKMNGIEVMQRFLETEIAYRQTRPLRYLLDLARLPQIKSLDNFDCHDTPIQQEQLRHLAECQFIGQRRNLLLSGKTHIALAIAYAALQKHYRVKFYLFSDLARNLLHAKEHRYEASFMARLQRFHLLVVDEMGYFPVDQQAEALLFELFAKLYEKTSLIITTHLTFDEWAPYCKILETGNISWRLKEGNMVKK